MLSPAWRPSDHPLSLGLSGLPGRSAASLLALLASSGSPQCGQGCLPFAAALYDRPPQRGQMNS
jgi:hypothetical protein